MAGRDKAQKGDLKIIEIRWKRMIEKAIKKLNNSMFYPDDTGPPVSPPKSVAESVVFLRGLQTKMFCMKESEVSAVVCNIKGSANDK